MNQTILTEEWRDVKGYGGRSKYPMMEQHGSTYTNEDCMDGNDGWSKETAEKYLRAEVPPVKLGNKNKTGECGMCGVKVKKLYPHKVGQVDFMICSNCKSIMSM